jgi:hypothetical protein
MAVGLALVAGVVGTSVGLFHAKLERAKAERASAQAIDANKLTTAKADELETTLYFNRIALAHREITSEPSNVKQAEVLLEACPPRLRNWEWHYLRRRRFSDPVVLAGGKPVHGLSFSPDGSHLASGGDEGEISIWDLASRKVIQTLSGHTGRHRLCSLQSSKSGRDRFGRHGWAVDSVGLEIPSAALRSAGSDRVTKHGLFGRI